VERIVDGLDRPSSLARLSDGRLLIAEAGGRIRVAEGGALDDQPALVIDDLDPEYHGTLDVALAADFTESRYVFVSYAARDGEGGPVGRVARFREVGGLLGERAVIVDGLPADAGRPRLRVGPDGMLYVASAALSAHEAGDRSSYAGKILRFTAGGIAPDDNPTPGSPVFAQGYAGRFEFDWEPEGGVLWHVAGDGGGLSIGRTRRGAGRHWEVLRIEGGEACDVAFHADASPASWHGSLLIAVPEQDFLYRVSGLSVSPPRPEVERLFVGTFGRIGAVLSADDGLYFATANGGADAAGRPVDAVYRVRDRTERR
jgi:glucose/arabinose dehydrogenase